MEMANKSEVEVGVIPVARVAVIGCGWWAQGEQCHLLPFSLLTPEITYDFTMQPQT
jgi:hypothetical protein